MTPITITPGTSTTITLQPTEILSVVGTAVATMGPGPQAFSQIQCLGSTALGPYGRLQVVYLSATPGGSAQYEIVAENGATFPPNAPQARGMGNRYILFGDSHAQLTGGPGSATPAAFNDYGLLAWINRLSGGRLDMVRNAGVGGNTTAQMLARMASDVFPYPADGVIMELATNDWANAIPLATTQQNIISMANALRDRGMWLGIIIAPPRSWTLPADNALLAAQLRGNDWLRQWAMNTPGVYLLGDSYATLIDPVSATGSYNNTNNTSNEVATPYIHKNNFGCLLVAQNSAPRIQQLFSAPTVLPDSVLRVRANNANEIAVDPLFQAAPLAVSTPAGVSGNLPTGVTCTAFTGAGTAAFSIVASSRGYGNDIELTLTATGAGSINIESNIATGAANLNAFNAADYQIVCGGWSRLISASATGVQRHRWRMLAGGSPPVAVLDSLIGAGTNQRAINTVGLDCTDVSPRFTINAGQSFGSSVRMAFTIDYNAAGTYVIRFGGPFLRVVQPVPA